jgi:hypothetical protein
MAVKAIRRRFMVFGSCTPDLRRLEAIIDPWR